jgi:hypothetical protein
VSTDIDGSAILILSFEEAKLVKAVLEAAPNFGNLKATMDRIMRKIQDVEMYESNRDMNARKWYEHP